MADDKDNTPPEPAPQEPVYNPEGYWETETDAKNEQAGIEPPNK